MVGDSRLNATTASMLTSDCEKTLIFLCQCPPTQLSCSTLKAFHLWATAPAKTAVKVNVGELDYWDISGRFTLAEQVPPA